MIQSRLKSYLQYSFYLDATSLGVFRIALGFVFLFNVIWIKTNYTIFFTEYGPHSKSLAMQLSPQSHIFGLFFNENTWFTNFLFAVLGAAALGFLIGYRPRWCALVGWYLLCCLEARNELVLDSSDAMLRFLLFWSIFIPIADRFCWRRESWSLESVKIKRYFSAATFGLILNLFLAYFLAGLFKITPAWIIDGTAIFQISQVEYINSSLSLTFKEFFRAWTKPLSLMVVFVEIITPIVLLLRLPRELNRYIFILTFAMFQIFSFLFLEFEFFPWVGIAGLLVLLPSAFWQKKKSIPIEGWVTPKYRMFYVFIIPILAVLFVNIVATLGVMPGFGVQIAEFKKIEKLVGVSQRWNLFGLQRNVFNPWLLVEGVTAEGQIIDPFRLGGAPLYKKPQDTKESYQSKIWSRYLHRPTKPNDLIYAGLPQYFCRSWNLSNPDKKVVEVKVSFLYEIVQMPDQKNLDNSFPAIRHTVFSKCFD